MNDTTCDVCSRSTPDADVQKCATCGRDGLCMTCLDSHDCEGDGA